MSRRKSDKTKLAENLGTGTGKNYKPWIKIGEFSSKGRATRVFGWLTKRIHQFLSDLEHYYFLLASWDHRVIDIREQYPLCIAQTMVIARELNIKHPCEKNQRGKEYVMTSDFVITIQDGETKRDLVRTIKPLAKLSKRVQDKFAIEEKYWNKKGIDWGVVTDEEIPKMLAKNLKYLYNNYFWAEKMKLSPCDILKLVSKFEIVFIDLNKDLKKVSVMFDEVNDWSKGESWNFIEYMIINKIVKTDLKNIKFSHSNLIIEFARTNN